MTEIATTRTSVSTLMGIMVIDASGKKLGRISEFLVDPSKSSQYVALIGLRSGLRPVKVRFVAVGSLRRLDKGVLQFAEGGESGDPEANLSGILLEKDLLDQQIIDVNGHKVVRVNDVDLLWEKNEKSGNAAALRISEVEIGPRGAIRRLLKGLPQGLVEAAACQFQARLIPWDCVDLIDRDPSRRIKLKIGQDRLASMHPSDIADILEELGPAERDAVFTSLDAETAAEALEEVRPKLQNALLEGMDSDRVADIIEEMDPGAAADLLSKMSDERSGAILGEMEPEERQEVEDLLEFPGDWAAGRMTTDYVHVEEDGSVADAVAAMREFEGDLETVSEVYLLDAEGRLRGSVTLSGMLLADSGAALKSIAEARTVSCALDTSGRQVAELFDKYNLRSLPVLNHERKLTGVIYAEHVISLLRAEH